MIRECSLLLLRIDPSDVRIMSILLWRQRRASQLRTEAALSLTSKYLASTVSLDLHRTKAVGSRNCTDVIETLSEIIGVLDIILMYGPSERYFARPVPPGVSFTNKKYILQNNY